jgi:hypothetical protein
MPPTASVAIDSDHLAKRIAALQEAVSGVTRKRFPVWSGRTAKNRD